MGGGGGGIPGICHRRMSSHSGVVRLAEPGSKAAFLYGWLVFLLWPLEVHYAEGLL